jgi:C_GCAxxG_C_C family probable redox protein
MSSISNATSLFIDGFACSQAILSVYGHPLGLPRKTAMQIAAGFAGGMRLGETCGAVTGAFMVLGLRHASENCDTAAGRAEVYAHVVEFAKRFQSMNGSVACRELLGCDISTPEGMVQAQERNLFKTTCVKMVEDSAMILEALWAESQHIIQGDAKPHCSSNQHRARTH